MKKYINCKSHSASNKGYTLVELIVSMALTALLATAVVAVMSPAGRVFKHVQMQLRAQLVADMVVDSLREECADSYIEDFTSVRIVNESPTSAGDAAMLGHLVNIVSESETEGNVLIVRKTGGYCEAIYSDIAISYSNYDDVKARDYTYKNSDGISSRAVYRLFDATGTPLPDTEQGFVHFAYYQCGRTNLELDYQGDKKKVAWTYPAIRYDYTNPFSRSAYSGYTVSITFKDLTYTPAPGETRSVTDRLYTERPESVTATVNVYNCSYSEQSSEKPIYSREVLLVFAEDTTK